MKCYTIGHSNRTLEHFLDILTGYKIERIIDVRSYPYSNFTPQFDRDKLPEIAIQRQIQYIYFGEMLGGRSYNNEMVLPNGRVDYCKLRSTKEYQKGIRRVGNIISNGAVVCLMCSEKDPYDCHRFVLISYDLQKIGFSVEHILEDGSIITNAQLEKRLKIEYAQTNIDNSAGFNNNLEELYKKRNMDIAFQAYK